MERISSTILKTEIDTRNKEALKELRSGLINIYGGKTPDIYIYGSYARQEAQPYSDLDVLLIYPDEVRPGEEINRISDLLAALNIRTQVLISILPISENCLSQARGSFWNNLKRDGKLYQPA